MRAPASITLALALGFGLLLGACGEEEHEEHEGELSCSDAETMRVDVILALPPDETAGATVFANTCGNAGCHGDNGTNGSGPDLSEEIPELDMDALGCLLLAGVESMPSQASLSDQELADVIAYVRTTF